MKKIYSVIGLILFFFGNAQQYNKISERAKRAIDSTYNSLIKKHNVVGLSLAIVDNGEVVYSNGYGFADRKNKIAANDKTIYRICSGTKSFTSLSLLQLQEKGKLKLSNSLKDYLPELKLESRFNDNNSFYINDMMCHVSGLPSDIWNGSISDTKPTIKWTIEELNKQTTIAPRQHQFAYSNLAYDLLGEVIARLGKTTFSNYLRENIFSPLQMNSSFIIPEEMFVNDMSKAYCKNREFKEPLLGESGAGGILSNVIDMTHYIQMFLNNGNYKGKQIISATSLGEMKTNQLGNLLVKSSKSYGYGLGIDKIWVKTGSDSNAVSLIGHEGGSFAFRSVFRFIPELNLGVIILTNTDNGEFIWFENQLLDIYLKETKAKTISTDYTEPVKSNVAQAESPATDDEIVGQYNMGEVLVNVKNTKRITTKAGAFKVVLKPKTSNSAYYTRKILLLGFIPIKKLPGEIKFVKINSDIYAKEINTRNRKEEYIAVKAKPLPIPAIWKEKCGTYKITGTIYKCTDCPDLVFEGTTLKLSESMGFIVMEKKHKISDMNNTLYLNVVTNELAVTGGIGRGTGEAVRILDNGSIYYSGFEFVKQK